MGILDIEDVEDFIEEDYVYEESNKYLSNNEDAVNLIAKIISLSKSNFKSTKDIQRLDDMLTVDFLSAFKKVQLNNEAQLQLKLEMLSDKLIEQKKYRVLKNKSIVGIGGKFSAGKSKFINSILKAGEELLPEDQNPTTSIPTYILQGQTQKINAYTSYNEEVDLDIEQLQALTHKFYEKYNMGFSSFINCLIITEPNLPYKDIVFLDTPGYSKADSINEEKKHKEITDENKAYVQLRSVDYLIWLVDIENGVLSETDINFISKLGIETPILIVLNKSDKKTDYEIEQIIKLVETTAKDSGINVFAVTAYSSRNREEWKGNNFINKFIENSKTQAIKKDDILVQIKEINKTLSDELEKKIDSKINERNNLNNIIFKVNDIQEIKTLIDIYGESMEEIREMIGSKKKYKNNVSKLEKELYKHFNRG